MNCRGCPLHACRCNANAKHGYFWTACPDILSTQRNITIYIRRYLLRMMECCSISSSLASPPQTLNLIGFSGRKLQINLNVFFSKMHTAGYTIMRSLESPDLSTQYVSVFAPVYVIILQAFLLLK